MSAISRPVVVAPGRPPSVSTREWLRGWGMSLAAGEVAFLAASIRRVLVARLDDGYPVRTSGYGGWQDVERPGRPAASHYVGPGALMLSIPIILGRWQQGWSTPIDGEVELLERMARQPADAARGRHPPILDVRGPVPHGGVRWVVDDLQWGDDGVVVDGRLVRIRVTVVLRRYVRPELVVVAPSRRREQRARTATVRRGERWPQFAARVMGARGSRELQAAWSKVRKLNPRLRDQSALRAGMRVRVPR